MRGAPDLHVLFGWLQVDHKVPVAGPAAVSVASHPHLVGPPYGRQDAIYVAHPDLTIPSIDSALPVREFFIGSPLRLS